MYVISLDTVGYSCPLFLCVCPCVVSARAETSHRLIRTSYLSLRAIIARANDEEVDEWPGKKVVAFFFFFRGRTLVLASRENGSRDPLRFLGYFPCFDRASSLRHESPFWLALCSRTTRTNFSIYESTTLVVREYLRYLRISLKCVTLSRRSG